MKNAFRKIFLQKAILSVSAILIFSACSGGGGSGGSASVPVNTWVFFTTTPAPSVKQYEIGSIAGVYGGKLGIWGGYNGSTYLNTGEIYDFNSNTWTSIPTTGAPVQGAAEFSVRGIYGDYLIAYGRSDGTTSYFGGGIYNLKSGVWAGLGGASLNSGYIFPAPFVANNLPMGSQFFFFASTSGSNICEGRGIFDLNGACSFVVPTAGPIGSRRRSAITAIGSKAFLWGGYRGGVSEVNEGFIFDTLAGTWQPTSVSPLAAREGAGAAYTSDKVFVFGGFSIGGATTPYADGAVYTVSTDSWSLASTVGAPDATSYTSVTAVGPSKFVVIGQSFVAPYSLSGAIYDANLDKWTPLPMAAMPSAGTMLKVLWDGIRLIVISNYSIPTQSYSGAFYYP